MEAQETTVVDGHPLSQLVKVKSSTTYPVTTWNLAPSVHSHKLPLMNSVSQVYITTTTTFTPSSIFTNTSLQTVLSENENDSTEVTLKIAMGLGFYTLALLTFIGNAMVLHAIRTEKRLQTVSNLFIMSLAVADLIVGLFVMPMSAAYILNGQWTLGIVACEAWLSTDYIASTASIYNLFILSLDRYWSIISPLRYIRRRTRKRARIMIAAAWILSFMWVIPVTSWHWLFRRGVRLQPVHICETEFASDALFKVTTAVANFYIPTILMVYVYSKIFCEIRQRSVSGLAHQSRSNSSHQQQDPSASVAGITAIQPLLDENWDRQRRADNCQLPRRTNLHKCAHIPTKLAAPPLENNGNPAKTQACFTNATTNSSHPDLTHLRLSFDGEDVEDMFFKHPKHRRCHRSQKGTTTSGAPLSLPITNAASYNSTSHYQSLTLLALPLSPSPIPTVDDCLNVNDSLVNTIKLPAAAAGSSPTAASLTYFHGIQVQVDYVPDNLDEFTSAINGFPITASPTRLPCRSRVNRRSYGTTLTAKKGNHDKRTPPVDCPTMIGARKRTPSGDLQHTKSKVSLFVLQKEKKAARQLGVIVAAFLLCWLPYFVLFAVVAHCEACVDKRLYTWTIWLGYINSTLNPFLYPLCNTNFKRAFKRMLRLSGKVRPAHSYRQKPYLMQMNSAFSVRNTPERSRY